MRPFPRVLRPRVLLFLGQWRFFEWLDEGQSDELQRELLEYEADWLGEELERSEYYGDGLAEALIDEFDEGGDNEDDE